MTRWIALLVCVPVLLLAAPVAAHGGEHDGGEEAAADAGEAATHDEDAGEDHHDGDAGDDHHDDAGGSTHADGGSSGSGSEGGGCAVTTSPSAGAALLVATALLWVRRRRH